MDIIVNLFNTVLYLPLFNALIWLYNNVSFGDLGIAIVILTVLIRFILYPFSKKAISSQKSITALQPEIKKIQKESQNKEEQARQMMELYKKHKVNPMAGCLPILIQLPILIALYRVFFAGLDMGRLEGLYSFIQRPETINFVFLGLVDLSKRSIVFAFLAGALQFFQSKMILGKKVGANQSKKGKPDFSSMMGQQMTYFMPLLTIMIAWNMPAALPLYWIVITVFNIVQQKFTTIIPVKQTHE